MKRFKKSTVVLAFAIISTMAKGQYVISGVIRNDNSEPVPFATVYIEKTQLSVSSGVDGSYKFKPLKNGKYILHVKSMGFADRSDTLDLQGDLAYSPVMEVSSRDLDEVVVDATRVDDKNGMAYNNISSEQLKKQNLGQDAPYLLNNLPNVVINSDAGNGVGYTGIRIRGSDATRINVTINGVPVNDAESQGTFWVNMPDLVSSVNNVQVQRGVGASSNGAGAFGATINFQTNTLNEKPYAGLASTAGSFNTFRNTLSAGSGLMKGKFTFDVRGSKINSQGYIDRGSSDLTSFYIAGGYYGKKSVIKAIHFSGWEKTYQAWYFVPQDCVLAGNRTYNLAGEYYDTNGNRKYYENETDNYNQGNSQLHFIHQLNKKINFNVTAHYTKGKGYFEQYQSAQNLSDYQISPLITSAGDTIKNTDLIRRLWLDNDFAGVIFNLNLVKNSRLNFTLGGGYNTYFGKHFGRVVRTQGASDIQLDKQYYLNTANKNDRNIYLKTNYKLASNLHFFLDLQSRAINYRFLGYSDSLAELMQDADFQFFNPKVGLSYNPNSRLNLYASVARANKEPNRDDFVQSSPGSRPKPEQLTDVEAGFKFLTKKLFIGTNFYFMDYKDQLVLNGQVNNVGAYNRVNVPSSYRRGIEFEMDLYLNKMFSVGGNVSLSENKIKHFTEYIDSSDVNATIYTQYKIEHKNTDISFSPSAVGSLILSVRPVKNMEVAFIVKYVGRQFMDNTSNSSRSIDPYKVVDVRFNYLLKTKLIPEISFMLGLYNVLNETYETNGYTFGGYSGPELLTSNYLAPAAPFNFLGGIGLKF